MNSSLINTGDVSWMLMSTALVMLMTPGLALFYSGLVKKRNVINTLMMSMISLGVVSLLWITVGYSLAFAPGNGWIGGLDYFALQQVGQTPLNESTIPHNLFMAFQMMFAIITPALISGAVVGRMKFSTYTLFIGLWSLAVYSPLCHWVWGGGWLSEHGALDFAGGTVVHISAGIAALVAAKLIGPRTNKEQTLGRAHNIPMTLIGAALLWLGWFGFNAGSALGANEIAAHALLTTHVASAAALVAWVVLDQIFQKQTTLSGLCIGLVVGLVTITPAAGFVLATDAALMGIIGSVACYFTLQYLHSRSLDDTLDVFACHGVGGIVGSLLTGIFANTSVNPDGANGLLYGNADLLWPQLEATLVAIVFSGVVTAALIKALDATVGLKINAAQEKDIDQNLHGETAYAGGQHLPLGELLVHSGIMTKNQADECLHLQKNADTHTPFGEIVVQKRFATAQQIQELLLQQKLAA